MMHMQPKKTCEDAEESELKFLSREVKKWHATVIRKLNFSREVAESALEAKRFSFPFDEPSFK